MEADGHSYPAVNGVKCRLYGSFPWLYLQTSKPGAEFVPAPDWYYGFEYQQDLARGYDGYEDLLTTGYFETELKKGESIIFSASLDEMGSVKTIEEVFAASIARRTHKIDFISCLEHSARQFVIRRPGDRTEVVSGYPWHGVSGRQTFVSLPGITLEQGHKEDCIDALDTLVREMRDGMFTGNASAAVAADAPLWFFWTLQQLEREVGGKQIWKAYGPAMKDILESYRRGVGGRVALHDNGLVWAAADDVPMTWMNALIDGRPVTPRNGYQVEVNALWYNAVCYTLELAGKHGDKAFVKAWESLPARTQASFVELFRLPEGYLADFVGTDGPDKSTRPNMIVACGLDYKMLDEELQLEVIRTVRQHLLIPKGLRTLSPATCSTKVRRKEVRPQSAISRARTVRHGRGCCNSTSRHVSISTGMHSCRRPGRYSPISTKTSRATVSGLFASFTMPTRPTHRAALSRRRGASGPCSISTA